VAITISRLQFETFSVGGTESSIAEPADLNEIRAKHPFDRDEYDEVDQLGEGSFCSVVLLEHKITHHYAALKTLKYSGEDEQFKLDFLSEIQVLSSMKHPCIVHFKGVSTRNSDDEPAYAFEFNKNRSLQDVLHAYPNEEINSFLTPTQKTIIILGVAIALNYLHFGATKKGSIIHRDIKSGNILLDGTLSPKLADFGFSK
jgi:serine/threonine protein kinase